MASPNFQNRTLFKGDNLDFLRGMNSETVDLIATDPPFNKGKDFHATPESLAAGARFQDRWTWDDDVQPDWVDDIKDDEPRVYSLINHVVGGIDNDPKTRKRLGGREDLAAFLCFMGVRLIEMRRVLKDTGSLYLHCDPTASHYIKSLMDAIFGDKNFRNEIIWHYRRWTASAKNFQRMHDVIFRYTKSSSNDFVFNLQYEPYGDWIKKDYQYVDEETGKRWRWHTVKGRRYKVFLEDENKGVKLNDVWTIPYLGSTAKERMGYPTQKPLALYERIIKASSNEGDMVLDPFCGCATTPIAAERLGRQWVGMDLWDGAYDIVRRRMDDNKQLLADNNPQIIYTEDAPVRTDGGEDAPTFELRLQRRAARAEWQKLSHAEIRARLIEYQTSADGLVACAGCGRELESEFMELDHITPRAQGGPNWITNRILLCRPCNGRKRADYTLIGLQNQNRKTGWMRNAKLAEYTRIRVSKLTEDLVSDLESRAK